MTTFLLIRHGLTDAVGHQITGRLRGVHLNETGRRQAAQLPGRLARWKIAAIYSSPLERALETATPVAAHLILPVEQSAALSEVDFGDWSGHRLDELNQQPEWRAYNMFRSAARPPQGELMLEVQARMVDELMRLTALYPDQCVACFTHADAIRAALCHFLGMPLDLIQRLEIEPASISLVRVMECGPQVLLVNSVS